MGAKCMIGDQLPPRGRIEKHVYELIGQVYAEVEEKEPWCRGAKSVSEIAVFTPEEWQGARSGSLPGAIKGVTRMLEESSHQFDIVDSESDLSSYCVVILPDEIPFSTMLASKLNAYVENGGGLIATFESGLDPTKRDFALSCLGVAKVGDGPSVQQGKLVRGQYYPRGDYLNYLLPNGPVGAGLPPTEHAMYMRGMDVRANDHAEILAPLISPYFDRTWEHFCSHRQTPSSGQMSTPGIVRNGNAIYFANPIFRQYHQNAPLWCKKLFLNALDLLLPEPLVRHAGPSTIFTTLNEQQSENRWVLHLLHYIPERRGVDFDVIEDVIPLYHVDVSVRIPTAVTDVVTAPEGAAVDFSQNGERIEFTVPEINGHQMIVIQF